MKIAYEKGYEKKKLFGMIKENKEDFEVTIIKIATDGARGEGQDRISFRKETPATPRDRDDCGEEPVKKKSVGERPQPIQQRQDACKTKQHARLNLQEKTDNPTWAVSGFSETPPQAFS